MRDSLKYFLLAVAVLTMVPAMHAGTVYTNVSGWDGSTNTGPMGTWNAGGTPSYGETFVAPTGAVLSSFGFYLSDSSTTQIEASVYAWTGSLYAGSPSDQGTTGAALFSTDFSYTGNGTFQAVPVSTGNLQLVAGQAYILVFTVLSGGDSDILLGRVGSHVAGDGGGGLNFDYFDSPAGLWSGERDGYTSDQDDYGDLAYTANFNQTPEPSSLALLGTGMLGAFGMIRRRRSA